MTTEMPITDYTFPSAHFHPFFTSADEKDFTTQPAVVTSGRLPFTRAITHIYQETTATADSTAKGVGTVYAKDDGGSIILIVVMIATLLVFLCVALVFRYMLKHKGSYHTNEDKEANWTDSENAELKSFDDDLDEDI